MRILGIDPGYAIVGYGVLGYDGRNMMLEAMGAVTTAADMDFNKRLLAIYDDMRVLFQQFKPDAMSIERLYLSPALMQKVQPQSPVP